MIYKKSYPFVFLKVLQYIYVMICRIRPDKVPSIILFFLLLLPAVSDAGKRDSITVYLFLLDECRICQESAPEINEIYTKYKNKAGFVGIFPNFSSKPAAIELFKKKYGIQFATKTDYSKNQTNRFSATVLPEVVVFNESKSEILYRGAISDLYYSPGKRKQSPARHFLLDALDQWFLNQPIRIAETRPVGCFININDTVY